MSVDNAMVLARVVNKENLGGLDFAIDEILLITSDRTNLRIYSSYTL